jgi:hypothetical protein
MTAGQVKKIQDENIRGIDDADHIGQSLIAMQSEQIAEAKPEKPYRRVPLQPVPGSFLFRTKGVRQTSIKLRVFEPNPKYDDDDNRKYKNNWERNAQNVWGKRDKKTDKITVRWQDVLAIDKKLYENHGFEYINFRPVPGEGAQEATYVTRDPEIAAYIRLRIQEPDLAAIIYEEVGPTMAQLANGEWVEVLPASDTARQTMAAAAAGV